MTLSGVWRSPPKLVVWDLDNTLWDGVLMEGDACAVFPNVVDFIKSSDRKGVLHSVASRNDACAATAHLRKSGLLDYFVHPQIHWGAKSHSIARIVESLNIALDSALFVDDSEFELEEAATALPGLQTLNFARFREFQSCGVFDGLPITDDSSNRRIYYQQDIQRQEAERTFPDASEAFLATLGLRMTVKRAVREDLDRAAELVSRTNQLNSTGRLFTRAELAQMIGGGDRTLLVATLDDRFGKYGSIALVVLQERPERWTVELILVSCRVMSRGIGPILLDYLALRARQAGAALSVIFKDTGRNRAMKVALMMTGFSKTGEADAALVRGEQFTRELPSWLQITARW